MTIKLIEKENIRASAMLLLLIVENKKMCAFGITSTAVPTSRSSDSKYEMMGYQI
jgi:hypothetical protein